MRIVLADDEQKVRSALRLLLQELIQQICTPGQRDGCLIVEAGGAEALVRELRKDETALLLLDWELPGIGATNLVRTVRLLSPGCMIVAMSGRPEAGRDAIAQGADAFVSKNDPPDRLIAVLLRGLPALGNHDVRRS